jgi:putative ABC transport system substrate-binding protein
MRRRDFICVLGGAAIAVPLHASAQQRPRRLALAAGFTEEEMKPLLDALLAQLKVHGWILGQNLTLEARYGGGAYSTEQVKALIATAPDVIVTQGTGMLNIVRKETSTLPIVFTMVPDPVKLGIVDNIARPGGNITGFTNFEFSIAGKWLEFLKAIRPDLKGVLVICNPDNPNNVQFAKVVGDEGKSFGLEAVTLEVRTGAEIAPAITKAAEQRKNFAILTLPDSLLILNRAVITDTALKLGLPGMYPFRVFADGTGLIAYGLNLFDMHRDTAVYVDRILRGEKPGNLPVQAPTNFELVINLKVAKQLGIEMPPALLARADAIIE